MNKTLVGQWVLAKNNTAYAYKSYKITKMSHAFNIPYYTLAHDAHWFLISIDELMEYFRVVPELKARLYE